ncbi:hypothetical protein ASF31_02140 [Brevundimonas sp. Leaf280]|nr:hypothetical protein ASF31_02140 [Brevundimonas sp. Leaf280]
MLWLVTRTLAIETKRMAEASAQPQVVVSIEPNQWAINYADIVVANTGNATAFDVLVKFDPEIPRERDTPERPTPLQTVSLLRPGQKLVNFLSSFEPIIDISYTVTVSWKRQPTDPKRETLTYPLNLKEMDGRGSLGAADPMTQIATEVKNIREDWRGVAGGNKKIQADVFTAMDRLHHQRQTRRWMRQMRREQAAQQSVPNPPTDPQTGAE